MLWAGKDFFSTETTQTRGRMHLFHREFLYIEKQKHPQLQTIVTLPSFVVSYTIFSCFIFDRRVPVSLVFTRELIS